MTKEEALKLALEALKHLRPTALTSFYTIGHRDKAIAALRQAIEQAEQAQPVVTRFPMKLTCTKCGAVDEGFLDVESEAPPASKPWVGLTDEEVDECYYWKGRQWTTDELVRHVEAKLREKNA